MLTFVPATIEVTPVFPMVTAPVAPETEIPVPATLEVTPVLDMVNVSVALTTVPIPVPPVKVIVLPSTMVSVVDQSEIIKLLIDPPAGVIHARAPAPSEDKTSPDEDASATGYVE